MLKQNDLYQFKFENGSLENACKRSEDMKTIKLPESKELFQTFNQTNDSKLTSLEIVNGWLNFYTNVIDAKESPDEIVWSIKINKTQNKNIIVGIASKNWIVDPLMVCARKISFDLAEKKRKEEYDKETEFYLDFQEKTFNPESYFKSFLEGQNHPTNHTQPSIIPTIPNQQHT